jgi:hypothetical protein
VISSPHQWNTSGSGEQRRRKVGRTAKNINNNEKGVLLLDISMKGYPVAL